MKLPVLDSLTIAEFSFPPPFCNTKKLSSPHEVKDREAYGRTSHDAQWNLLQDAVTASNLARENYGTDFFFIFCGGGGIERPDVPA